MEIFFIVSTSVFPVQIHPRTEALQDTAAAGKYMVTGSSRKKSGTPTRFTPMALREKTAAPAVAFPVNLNTYSLCDMPFLNC
jgi:hypothetical protein